VWTLAQGRALVEAVGHPHFGLCLDLWNVWQGANIEAEIRACGDRTFVVQLADWRLPRSFEDRLVPGRGEIPLPPLLRAVHESGYRGPYVVEIFSSGVPDALWDGDLEQVLRDSRAGLDRAWAQAFAGGAGD
jgi:sugar phosphate isomerase/epimerase